MFNVHSHTSKCRCTYNNKYAIIFKFDRIVYCDAYTVYIIHIHVHCTVYTYIVELFFFSFRSYANAFSIACNSSDNKQSYNLSRNCPYHLCKLQYCLWSRIILLTLNFNSFDSQILKGYFLYNIINENENKNIELMCSFPSSWSVMLIATVLNNYEIMEFFIFGSILCIKAHIFMFFNQRYAQKNNR